jgi:hypothetical protein
MRHHGLIFKIGIFTSILFLTPTKAFSLHLKNEVIKTVRMDFAPNRLIVKLKTDLDKDVIIGKIQEKITTGLVEIDKLNSKFKVEKQEKLFKGFEKTALKSDKLSSIYVLEVPAGTDLKQMKAEYESSPEVEYAEVDCVMNLFEEPKDPLFPHQWYLNNLGIAQNDSQGYYGIDRTAGHVQVRKFGKEDADIDALEAFGYNQYESIPLIGIIDTGVDTEHEDLRDNLWVNPGEDLNGNGVMDPDEINGIDDDHDGFVDDFYGWDFSGDSTNIQPVGDNDPTDLYGHGTHIAGIIAGVRNNGTGISGINTPCRIVAVKIFPNSYSSICSRGIIYAADMGCDLINMSWGTSFPSKTLEEALNYAVEKGVLPIAAAGNTGREEYFYPASYPQVYAVGATNSKDEVTSFSAYGKHIQVVAPGEDILSLRADTSDMYAEDGFPNTHIVNEKYYLADGTSMAAPMVTGVAAYILSSSPGITKERVKEIIDISADDILYPYGGDTLYSPGKDIYSGFGRVNLYAALEFLSCNLAKIDYPCENALISGDVAIIGTAAGDSFQNYILEYGEGYYPQVWQQLTSSDIPVNKDTLAVWNTSGLSGLYTLRLKVGDENQVTIHLVINMDTYVMISSPLQNDTIRGYAEIYGYTLVPGFSHYELEYGCGEFPSTWIAVISSSRMVADGLLGKWVTGFLSAGTYMLRLSVKDGDGQVYTSETKVTVETITSGGWFRNLSSCGSLSPVMGDVDGDKRNEIVIGVGGPLDWGKTGGIWVFNDLGELEPGWPRDTSEDMMSSPALGDLDGDGIDDIVICSNKGIHAYLSKSSSWFKNATTGGNDFWSLSTPLIADLENDGSPEVLTINNSGTIYAWRGNGTSVIPDSNGVFAHTTESDEWMGFPCLAVADLDQDGEKEVIAGSARGYGDFGHYSGIGGIYIFDVNGNLLLSPQDYPEKLSLIYGIAIANIDPSEDLEVITFGQNEDHLTLCALKKNGAQAVGYPVILEDPIAGWWYGNHPAVGDLNGDGKLEIVASIWTIGEARIYAWRSDGSPLNLSGPLVAYKSSTGEKRRQDLSYLGRNIGEISAQITKMSREEIGNLVSGFTDTVFASEAETFGSPILADVNGDAKADIVVRAGYYLSSGHERVYAWDYGGNLIPGWPLYTSSEASILNYLPYSPLVHDLDEDGKVDLILATDWPDYKLICWKFDASYFPLPSLWSKYMHDKWNSGDFLGNLQPPQNVVISSADSHSVILRWTANDFATCYKVYRKSWIQGDTFDLIGTTSDTSLTDSSINLLPASEQKTLFYGVKVRNLDYNSSMSKLLCKFDQRLYARHSSALFNIISLPVINQDINNAKELSNFLPASGSVCTWYVPTQRFITYDSAVHWTNFSVSPGQAYGIFQTSNSIWTLAGPALSGSFYLKTSFLSDFNLIAVPLNMPDTFSAAELCEVIPNCNSIAFWDAEKQGFIQYVKGLEFKDFPIEPGNPYFVSVSLSTIWDCSDLSAKSTIKHSKVEINPEVEYSSSFNVSERVHAPHLICGRLDKAADSVSATLLAMPGFKTNNRSPGSDITGDRWFLQIGSPYYGWRWGDIALVKIFSKGVIERLQVVLSWDLLDSTTLPFNGIQLPKDFLLSQNFPNPFNSGTTVKYNLPKSCQVRLQIYNILGQKVRTLVDKIEEAGYREVYWEGKNDLNNSVASGVYFYKIEAEDFVETKKMILMK